MQKKLSDQKAANAPVPPPTPGPLSPEAPPSAPARAESTGLKTHRIAVLDVQAQSSVPESMATGVLSLVVHDVRQRAVPALVVGADEIRAMVGVEHQKQLLGCTEVSCLAEIGGALGAEKLVLGSLSRFGETYVLDLKLVDARTAKVLAEGSARVKEEGALPDAVTQSVASLFPGGAPVDTSQRPELTQAPESGTARTRWPGPSLSPAASPRVFPSTGPFATPRSRARSTSCRQGRAWRPTRPTSARPWARQRRQLADRRHCSGGRRSCCRRRRRLHVVRRSALFGFLAAAAGCSFQVPQCQSQPCPWPLACGSDGICHTQSHASEIAPFLGSSACTYSGTYLLNGSTIVNQPYAGTAVVAPGTTTDLVVTGLVAGSIAGTCDTTLDVTGPETATLSPSGQTCQFTEANGNQQVNRNTTGTLTLEGNGVGTFAVAGSFTGTTLAGVGYNGTFQGMWSCSPASGSSSSGGSSAGSSSSSVGGTASAGKLDRRQHDQRWKLEQRRGDDQRRR